MHNDTITAISIAIFGLFFSAMGWLNKRSKSADYSVTTTTRVKIEGVTHSIIGSGLSVLLFTVIQYYAPDWTVVMQGTVAIGVGSLLSESVIKAAQRRIDNVK